MPSSLHFKINKYTYFSHFAKIFFSNKILSGSIGHSESLFPKSETILLTFISRLYLLCFIVFWEFGLSKKRFCAFPNEKETFCQHLVWVNSLATRVTGGLCWTSVLGSITKLGLMHRPAPRVQRLKRQLVTTKPTCGVFW